MICRLKLKAIHMLKGGLYQGYRHKEVVETILIIAVNLGLNDLFLMLAHLFKQTVLKKEDFGEFGCMGRIKEGHIPPYPILGQK